MKIISFAWLGMFVFQLGCTGRVGGVFSETESTESGFIPASEVSGLMSPPIEVTPPETPNYDPSRPEEAPQGVNGTRPPRPEGPEGTSTPEGPRPPLPVAEMNSPELEQDVTLHPSDLAGGVQ